MGPPCEVCRKPERTDTTELSLLSGGTLWACGACGYQLVVDGDVGHLEDEEELHEC